mmetsp:Transcript_26621/g.79421  ORF Transcript_26621/g.79421 Transcript_26621/m.79421 type:complete len:308 (+) Transcript_26621:2593-3516(+)
MVVVDPDEILLVRVGHHSVRIDVVHVLVCRPALLIEGPRIGCLKEQHHVVEDWPQEGHAELHVLLQLLAPRPHRDVVVLDQQLVDLMALPGVLHVDARPAYAHDPRLLLLAELLDERQEGKVSAIARRLVLDVPLPVLILHNVYGELEGHHEGGVVGGDVGIAFQVLDEAQLLLGAILPHGGTSHLVEPEVCISTGVVIQEIVVVAYGSAILPIHALVIFDDHLRTRSCERPVVLLCFPPVLLHAIRIGNDDVLVLYLCLELNADGSWGFPDREDVLGRIQEVSPRRVPVPEARVVAHDTKHFTEAD